jgi:hypothetical protein
MRAHDGPTVPAYRAKALYLCASELGGAPAAAAFIERSPVGRAEDDETATLPMEQWIEALRVFDVLVGEAGFARLPAFLVHPTNLGHWSLLLRGAQAPDDVYRRLVTFSGEHGAAGDWTEEAAARHRWRASCPVAALAPGDRKLIAQALIADLAAVPLLFGRQQARVDVLSLDSDRIVLEASFPPQSGWLDAAFRFSPPLAGALTGLAVGTLGRPFDQAVGGALGMLLVGGLASFLIRRELAHGQSDRGQRTRIQALERETSVHEEHAQNAQAPRDRPIAGEYELGEQLGVGGAGAVWEARRVRDGAIVALKLLRSGPASDSRASDRLQREAEALGLTWHPNIVRIFDHGILQSGLGYLVMERLRGETLAARSRRLRGLPVREVVRWGIQAAEALRAVHSAGIVHRDVKPGNLFVHREGNREVLKVLDFGAAYVDWAETRLTRDGAAVGTPGYAAPEQERGADADPVADIYSLGVSLLELWTGEPPDAQISEARLRVRLASSRVGTGDALSRGLQELLLRMTSSEANDRPANARVVRGQLQELLGRVDSEDPHAKAPPVAAKLA